MCVDELIRRADPVGPAGGSAIGPTWRRHFNDIYGGGRRRRRRRRALVHAGLASLAVMAVAAVVAAVVVPRLPGSPAIVDHAGPSSPADAPGPFEEAIEPAAAMATSRMVGVEMSPEVPGS